MNAQDLKNSILQRAIEGKLVPQRKEEGTAKELLAEIRAEKARLVKEKKIKKSKPLPEITDEEKPFDIPASWEWVRLDTVTREIGDIDHKMPQTNPMGNIPFISPKDFTPTGIDFSNAKRIGEDDYNRLARKTTPEKGDIIFPRYGTIGVTRRVITNSKFIVSYSCCTIKMLSNSMDADYIDFVLKSPLITNEIHKYVNKTTQPNVGLKSIKMFLFPLPPLAEQHRIVAKIEEIRPDIDAYDKAQTQLQAIEQRFPDAMKKSLLQYAIEGKLVPQRKEEGTAKDLLVKIRAEKAQLIKEKKIKKTKPLPAITDDEKPFDIPDNWEWVHLDDIVIKDIKRGKSPTYTVKSNILVFAQKCNTKKGYIDLSLAKFLDEEKFKKYPATEYMINDDIIINSTGTGTLGRVGFFQKENLDDVIVPDSHVTIIRTSKNSYARYVFYVLKANQPIFERMGEGSTKQKELRPSSLASFVIPLPPLAEQHRIVAKLEELLPLCQQLAANP
ncbi:restriction endonuclease subunit S [Mitsuokella jalaludinii]